MFSPHEHLNEPITEGESYRDRITTVDEDGKRKWVFAYKPPNGKFYNIRTWLSVLYFILFFGMPFVYVNDRPFFLLNIPQAKFIFFGKSKNILIIDFKSIVLPTLTNSFD